MLHKCLGDLMNCPPSTPPAKNEQVAKDAKEWGSGCLETFNRPEIYIKLITPQYMGGDGGTYTFLGQASNLISLKQ